MTNFDIKINIKKLLERSESLEIAKDKKIFSKVVESFSHHVLTLYGTMIEEGINSRRYKGQWEPVDDEGYLEYLGTTPTDNILLLIKDAMEVRKIGYNFVVRINPRYKYPGTDMYLIHVLRAIENGTSKFNARPLISNLSYQIRNHIIDLWRGYITIKRIT